METIQTCILFFLIWPISSILFRAIFAGTQTKLKLPPSPLYLPIIGHLHLCQPPLHRTLQKLSNRYGPLIHIYLGSLPCVVVSSAEIAKEIFKTHDISFCNRPANTAIRYFTYNAADFVFAPYGSYWKFMKKLCMSELLNGRMLDQFLPIRQEEISSFLWMLHKKAEVGETVDVGGELLRLANSIIMRMAVSKSCFNPEDDVDEVRQRLKESVKLSGSFNLSDYFWFCEKLDLQGFGKKLKEVRDRFDTMIEKIIQEHEEARKGSTRKDVAKDILDICLSISEDKGSEIKITKENIKGFLRNIFSGGTDTTAIAIEWALSELINQPAIMKKARDEIDSVIGKDRIVIESDIANLPYLEAIVKETLRLHPPGSLIVRESTEYCNISGFDIPSNTRVLINVWALGRDPKYWENPLEFHPERFLEGRHGQLDVRGQSYQLLPFGSGRRGCPGASLALNVIQSTLGAMIQCFEWKVGNEGNNGKVDMAEATALTVARAHPLTCIPAPRLNPFPPFLAFN